MDDIHGHNLEEIVALNWIIANEIIEGYRPVDCGRKPKPASPVRVNSMCVWGLLQLMAPDPRGAKMRAPVRLRAQGIL